MMTLSSFGFHFLFLARRLNSQKTTPAMASPMVADPPTARFKFFFFRSFLIRISFCSELNWNEKEESTVSIIVSFLIQSFGADFTPSWDVSFKIWPSRASFVRRLSSAKNSASLGSTHFSFIYCTPLIALTFMVKAIMCSTSLELFWTRYPMSEVYGLLVGDST